MNRLFSIATLLTLSLLVSGCGGGDSSSSSEDPTGALACNAIGLNTRVLNGASCSNSAASSVVRLIALDDFFNPISLCSGTLITPTQVLTASHCFEQTAFYVVESGDRGTASNFEANVIELREAPDFRLGGPDSSFRLFNDASIAVLDRPIPSPTMPILFSREAQVGEQGFVFGFGATEFGNLNASVNVLQGGGMTIREVTNDHIFVRFDGDGVNICAGDSGGPIVVLVDGQPAVAGIVSQGSLPGCLPGDVTTFTNVQSNVVLPWLTSEAPNADFR